jgi:hypothetical protein
MAFICLAKKLLQAILIPLALTAQTIYIPNFYLLYHMGNITLVDKHFSAKLDSVLVKRVAA